MRLQDIIEMGTRYLGLGLIVVLVLGGLFLFAYKVIYQKLLKGEKRLSKWKLIFIATLSCYMIIVLGATLGSRPNVYQFGNVYLQPFISYKEAWNTFSSSSWRNIILNICMFIPFGLLLPLVSVKIQKAYWIYLSGFVFSLVIEGIQLMTQRGIFEVDDLINNTLGCMIGYGLFKGGLIIYRLLKGSVSKRECGLGMLVELPLVVCVATFGTLFYVYAQQELGNFSFAPKFSVNMNQIELINKTTFSSEVKDAPVYHSKKATAEETLAVANQWFSYVDSSIDETQTIVYDDVIIYYSNNPNASIWVDFVGPTVRFNNFDEMNSSSKVGYTLVEVREFLRAYGIELPDEVIFTDEGNGDYTIVAQLAELGDSIVDGTLNCTLTNTGDVKSVSNQLIQYEFYDTFELISEQEAFEQVEKGNFSFYQPSVSETIVIEEVDLTYEMDSKGFYQPVYVFSSLVNGEADEIKIPAIK